MVERSRGQRRRPTNSSNQRETTQRQAQSRGSRTGRQSGRQRNEDGQPQRSRRGGGQRQRQPERDRSSFDGRAGREQSERERQLIRERREAAANRANDPFRLWMPGDSERDVLVLDQQIVYFRYEHALLNPSSGRNDKFLPCIDYENGCNVCHSGDRHYYGMFMSVIDLEGYENKQNEWIPWTRKLMLVKSGMQRDWFRLEDSLEQDGGIRGAVVRLFRDSAEKPSTGNSIEFLEFAPEEEIEQYVREWTDRENKLRSEDCRVAYDYAAIFPPMTSQEIASAANVEYVATPGSRDEERQEFDDGQGAYETDESLDQNWDRDGGEPEYEEDEVPFDTDDQDQDQDQDQGQDEQEYYDDDGAGQDTEVEEEEEPQRERRPQRRRQSQDSGGSEPAGRQRRQPPRSTQRQPAQRQRQTQRQDQGQDQSQGQRRRPSSSRQQSSGGRQRARR